MVKGNRFRLTRPSLSSPRGKALAREYDEGQREVEETAAWAKKTKPELESKRREVVATLERLQARERKVLKDLN